jgi:lyso-ornithine lipid O-acyltransferase
VKGAMRAIAFLSFTLPLMPLQLLFICTWPRMAKRFPHLYHRVMRKLLGLRVNVAGSMPSTGARLIVSNHVSWLDIVVLSSVAELSFVAKREVGTWPFFGWLAKLQRTVFVDRDRRLSTGKSQTELEQRLRAGETLVLFPEGTSHTGAAVLPFKSSFFAAATADDVTLVPLTMAYRRHWALPLMRHERPRVAWYGDMDLLPHLWQALCSGPIGVDVIIHNPLDFKNRKQAAAETEALIRHSLAAALHGRAILRYQQGHDDTSHQNSLC